MKSRSCICAAALALLLAGAAPLAAEELVVEVLIKSKSPLKSAVGVLLLPSGSQQVPTVQIQERGAGEYIVAIPYQAEQSAQATATAVGVAEDGSLVFADLRPLLPPNSDESEALPPDCAPDIAPLNLYPEVSKLEYIVGLRERRRDNNLALLRQTLTGDFLDKLRKFEKGFGLPTEPPLSADLNPFELADRTARILQALRNFAAHQETAEEGE